MRRIIARKLVSVQCRHVSFSSSNVLDQPDPALITPTCSESIKTVYAAKLRQLTKLLAEVDQKRHETHRRLVAERTPIIELIERTVCGELGRAKLVSVGSLTTGLAVDKTSDLDLCFIPSDLRFYRDFFANHNFKMIFMNQVMDLLKCLEKFDSGFGLTEPMVPLYRAHVPIIICNFKNGLGMDLQFPEDNFHAIRNTNLIRHYVAADSRFPQLYIYVRTLFNVLGVRNSKEGLLSSYHIILLVIHFLQSRTHPQVVPVLCTTHKQRVDRKLPLSELIQTLQKPLDTLLEWRSENKTAVALLAVDFMNYYAHLDTATNAIDIKLGRLVRKRQIPGDSRLLLYDPYSRFTVSRGGLIPEALRITCSYVYNNMMKGSFLDSFPNFPEGSNFKLTLR